MRLNDLFDFERGPGTLLAFALSPLVLLIVCQVVVALLGQLSATGTLAILLFMVLMSPLAYLIRRARRGRAERGGGRRGAERTPLLPSNEGDAE